MVLAWVACRFGACFLGVWRGLGLGCVVLSPAGVGVVFGIGASGGAGVGGICVGGRVALHSLTFARKVMKGTI